MKTYTITEDQIVKIETALTLAEYFIQEHWGVSNTDQLITDDENYRTAVQVIQSIRSV